MGIWNRISLPICVNLLTHIKLLPLVLPRAYHIRILDLLVMRKVSVVAYILARHHHTKRLMTRGMMLHRVVKFQVGVGSQMGLGGFRTRN